MAGLLSTQYNSTLSKFKLLRNNPALSVLTSTRRKYSSKDGAGIEYLHKSVVPTMHYQKSLPRYENGIQSHTIYKSRHIIHFAVLWYYIFGV